MASTSPSKATASGASPEPADATADATPVAAPRTADVQPAPGDERVAIGSRVTFTLNGGERTLTIVGHDEADPALGSIAFSAPLARAMMDAEEGESVDFGGKPGAIMILAIEAILEE